MKKNSRRCGSLRVRWSRRLNKSRSRERPSESELRNYLNEMSKRSRDSKKSVRAGTESKST